MSNELTIVLDILRQDFPKGDADLSFALTGLDSLDYISFMHEVQVAFDVEIPKHLTFETPGELAWWIEQRKVAA